jgi:hypothetical protein
MHKVLKKIKQAPLFFLAGEELPAPSSKMRAVDDRAHVITGKRYTTDQSSGD